MLIVLVVCCLTLSLATRFCVSAGSPVHIAKALEKRSIDPKRQHLNRDAARWLPPAANATFLEHVAISLNIEPIDPPAPRDMFYETLYNRPPPSRISL